MTIEWDLFSYRTISNSNFLLYQHVFNSYNIDSTYILTYKHVHLRPYVAAGVSDGLPAAGADTAAASSTFYQRYIM